MAFIEKIQDINLRVAKIIKQQQQLKSQAQNWENLYKEATDVQKKLIEQGTENAKKNEALNSAISNLKTEIGTWEQKHELQKEKEKDLSSENARLKTQYQTLSNELNALRLREEQQLSLHFGAEKEQEQLLAIGEDLKEQLQASQLLNAELQTNLQNAKVTLVEEQAMANNTTQQKNSLEKEVIQLKERYQSQISELHSKISHKENQTEKLGIENRKLQENITLLEQSNEEKQQEITVFQDTLGEMEALLALPPAPHESDFLKTRLEQLTAQIANLEFEKELMRKTYADTEHTRPIKIAEATNQGSGENDDKSHFLYTELQASQANNSVLENQIHSYIEIIAQYSKKLEIETDKLKNIEEQNKIVKLAEAIEGNSVTSNIELRQKLNEMIKEVDRCIAKLSS